MVLRPKELGGLPTTSLFDWNMTSGSHFDAMFNVSCIGHPKDCIQNIFCSFCFCKNHIFTLVVYNLGARLEKISKKVVVKLIEDKE